MRPAIRDLISRLPKRRGFRNKPKGPRAFTVQLAHLMTKTKSLSADNPVAVNLQVLKKINLVPSGYHGKVKILGRGEVSLALLLDGIETSESVAAAIEKAGGKLKARMPEKKA